MSAVIMKQLLESGAHFGHKTRRWNPKMAEFIYGERDGVHIIDLRKTVEGLLKSMNFLREAGLNGKKVLFVGTKRQVCEVVAEEAARVGAFYVSERWLGGMLTNFDTVRNSVSKLKSIRQMDEDGTIHHRPKREVLSLRKTADKLEKFLAGVKDMDRLPDVIFVVDIGKEHIAVKEAKILGIPVLGVVDTNCDPEQVDMCIPSNDDAIKATRFILSLLADSYAEGWNVYQEGVIKALKEKEAKEKAEAEERAAAKAAKEAAEKARKAKVKEEEKAKEEAAAQEAAEQESVTKKPAKDDEDDDAYEAVAKKIEKSGKSQKPKVKKKVKDLEQE